ncbi:hypothetical protein V6N12_069575 [Hibiscus sabdariffa]|uniref:Uncharacterized protein n=1 Tax=Hibiscus sabdariffa TaxID=183260 RepID=A0ABR2FEL5_9ROSI
MCPIAAIVCFPERVTSVKSIHFFYDAENSWESFCDDEIQLFSSLSKKISYRELQKSGARFTENGAKRTAVLLVRWMTSYTFSWSVTEILQTQVAPTLRFS